MNTVTISLEDYEDLKKRAEFPIQKITMSRYFPTFSIDKSYMSKEDFECELEREVKGLQNEIVELKKQIYDLQEEKKQKIENFLEDQKRHYSGDYNIKVFDADDLDKKKRFWFW